MTSDRNWRGYGDSLFNSIVREISLDIVDPDAPFAQALSSLSDAAQKSGVVFELMVEPASKQVASK
jgi:hypothetical protein